MSDDLDLVGFTPLSRSSPDATRLLVEILKRDDDLKAGRTPRAIPELAIDDPLVKDATDLALTKAALDLVRTRDRQIELLHALVQRLNRTIRERRA